MSAPKRLLILLTLALSVVPLSAQPAKTVIKLATLVPANSIWDLALRNMGSAWRKDTAERVQLTVFAGGTTGSEATMVRNMRQGVLQAAFITAVGLPEVDEAFNVFSIPFFIDTPEEEAAIQRKLQPVIEERLKAKGLHLLCWGSGGWVNVFSKRELHTLDDLKKAKLYTTKGSDKWVNWYVKNGFNPVALEPTDIVPQLKIANGQIDTAPYPPFAASVLQVYKDAPNMLDLRIAPFEGALLVSQAAWSKISEEDRGKMTAAAQAFETKLRADAPAKDAEAVAAMAKNGLKVIKLDAKAANDFHAAANQLAATMKGTMVPDDIYTIAVQERDAFRKSKGK